MEAQQELVVNLIWRTYTTKQDSLNSWSAQTGFATSYAETEQFSKITLWLVSWPPDHSCAYIKAKRGFHVELNWFNLN